MVVENETQKQMRRDVIEVLMEKFPSYPPERIGAIAVIVEQIMARKQAGFKRA